jgi:hypothetical protein
MPQVAGLPPTPKEGKETAQMEICMEESWGIEEFR